MSKIYDIVQVESIEGRDKPVYRNPGIMLVKDDGKISMKLNSIPAGSWNGWFSLFLKKPKEELEETHDLEPF